MSLDPKGNSGFLTLAICLLWFFSEACNDVPPSGPGPPKQPWVIFNTTNSLLHTNLIRGIAVDNFGKAWVATDSGAYSYYRGSWRWYRDSIVARSNGIQVVTSVAVGEKQVPWFGLFGGGVIRIDPSSSFGLVKRYTEDDGLLFNIVLSVAFDGSNMDNVYCVGLFGVSRFTPMITASNEGYWTTYTFENSGLPTNQVRSVAGNYLTGTMWFGTHDAGAASYDGGHLWINYPLPSRYEAPIVSIAFDKFGSVWFGKWEGVSVLDAETAVWKQHYTYENTGGKLSPGIVNAVATDGEVTRWFGTRHGLVQFRDTTWSIYHPNNSPLPSDTITSLSYTALGHNLWIGTANGVAVLNENGVSF